MIPSVTLAAAVLVIALGGAEAGTAADAPAADRAAQAARTVLDGRYQREMTLKPAEFPGVDRRTHDRNKDGSPKDPEGRRKEKSIRERNTRQGGDVVLGGIMQAIAMMVVAVGVVMLILWILRDLRRGTGKEALEPEAVEATV